MNELIHSIPTTTMTDTTQEQLFALVGDQRSPFAGIAQWPKINTLVREKSQEMLTRLGREAWEHAGGKYDRHGDPSLQKNCDAMEEIVQHIEATTGGVLWRTPKGVDCAIRIERVTIRGRQRRIGYAVDWGHNAPTGFDPAAREDFADFLDDMEEKHVRASDKLAPDKLAKIEEAREQVRLFQRAEQLLWVVHTHVIAQRSSVVLVPDVYTAEAVWGARKNWPQNWRQDVYETLKSLSLMHSEVYHFVGPQGWQPQAKGYSVALAYVSPADEDIECRKNCPLYDTGDRHGHYRVQVGFGFLGALEKYVVERINGARKYNFKADPPGDAGKELKNARKDGQIMSTHLPLKIYGAARYASLAKRERKILNGLTQEVSRQGPRRKPLEVHGAQVAGTTPQETVNCPMLDHRETYAVFGGNGSRRGMGYRIVGKQWTGWLSKCGYAIEDGLTDDALRPLVRDWLEGIASTADIFREHCPLIAAGFRPDAGEWYDLREMRTLARQKSEWGTLDKLHVRVYAPVDYAERLRLYFADRAGFEASENRDHSREFRRRMGRLQITQKALAEHLGVSKQYVNKLMNGEGNWNEERVQRTENWLAKHEARSTNCSG